MKHFIYSESCLIHLQIVVYNINFASDLMTSQTLYLRAPIQRDSDE
jgi:hypothetical protein